MNPSPIGREAAPSDRVARCVVGRRPCRRQIWLVRDMRCGSPGSMGCGWATPRRRAAPGAAHEWLRRPEPHL